MLFRSPSLLRTTVCPASPVCGTEIKPVSAVASSAVLNMGFTNMDGGSVGGWFLIAPEFSAAKRLAGKLPTDWTVPRKLRQVRCKPFDMRDKKFLKIFALLKASVITLAAGCAIRHTTGQNAPAFLECCGITNLKVQRTAEIAYDGNLHVCKRKLPWDVAAPGE